MADPTLGATIQLKDLWTEGLKQFREDSRRTGEKVQEAFQKLGTRLDAMEAKMESARKGGQGLFAGLLAGVSKVANVVTAISTAVIAVGKVVTTVFSVISSAVQGLTRLLSNLLRTVMQFGRRAVQEFHEVAQGLDRIAKISKRLGIATQALRELRYAAQLSGVDARTLDMAVQRMTRRLGELAKMGRGEAKPAIEALGISLDTLLGKKPDEQFEMITKALSGVQDGSERLALAFKFFDSEGTAVLQMMGEGAEGIRRFRREFVELAGTISDAEFVHVQEMNDAFTRIGVVIEGLKERFVVELAPAITRVFTEAKEAVLSFMREHGAQLQSWVQTAAAYLEGWGVAAVRIFRDVFNFAVTESGLAWDGIQRALGAFLKGVGINIVAGFTTAFKTAGRIVSRLWENLMVDRFGNIAAKGLNAVIDVVGWFVRQAHKALFAYEGYVEFIWTNLGKGFVDWVVNPVIDGLNWIVKHAKIAWATIQAAFDFVAQNIQAGFNRVVGFVAGAVEDLLGIVRGIESIVGDLGIGTLEASVRTFREELDTTGMKASELGKHLAKSLRELDLTPAIERMKATGMTFDQMVANIGRKIAESAPLWDRFLASLKVDVADVPIGTIFETSIRQGLKASRGDIDAFLKGLTANFTQAFGDAFADADPKLKALLEKIAAHAAEATARATRMITDGIAGAAGDTPKPKTTPDNEGRPDSFLEGIRQGAAEIKEQFTALHAGMALVQDGIYGVADAFESRLVEAWQNGFKNMGEVVKAFASDVIVAFERILVNQAVQWLIRTLMGIGGGSATTAAAGSGWNALALGLPEVTAQGAAFEGGLRRWAQGGLPDLMREPTYFQTRDGAWNVGGEAGDEFVMPATRTRQGEMGVKAVLPEDAGRQRITYEDHRTISIDFNPKVQAQDARGVYDVLRQAEDRVVNRVMEALAETPTGHRVVQAIVRRSI